ncbi:MAG: hypothetical protein MJY61_05830 [Bacteroidales bacterium]|nr:hypothetical protein [Bacteroidales bacterium]
MEEKILCCILNYNENEKALEWYRRMSPHFDTVVLDSGSNPPCRGEGVVNLDNVFYSGLMNTAYGILRDKGYRWLMIVTSDLEIDDRNTELLVSRMRLALTVPGIGLYQPSCRLSLRGRSHFESRCHFTGHMRSVKFQEGWFHLVCREVLDDVFPIDLDVNRMGWGIDIALCYFARKRGLYVIVDDKVKVLHPRGTGYNSDKAKEQMDKWLSGLPGFVSARHFRRQPLSVKL